METKWFSLRTSSRETFFTVVRRCAIRNKVLPCVMFSRASMNEFSVKLSKAEVGSSNISISGHALSSCVVSGLRTNLRRPHQPGIDSLSIN